MGHAVESPLTLLTKKIFAFYKLIKKVYRIKCKDFIRFLYYYFLDFKFLIAKFPAMRYNKERNKIIYN